MTTNNQKSFSMPRGKSYFLISLMLSLLLTVGFVACFLFTPDFMFSKTSISDYNGESFFWAFNHQFLGANALPWQKGVAIAHWTFLALSLLWTPLGAFIFFRELFNIFILKKWWTKYTTSCTQIINSCESTEHFGKVAMVVCTCNDVLPSTIYQTAQQTYKNMDVWISDDSTKPEVLQKIDEFAKQHGYHVLHRSPEHKKLHPTKIGNLYYFLEKHGNEYEYIFENDSSSIVTPNFVENALRFLNSPLLDHEKDGGVIANGAFIGTKALIPGIYAYATQLAESTIMVGGTNQLCGHPTQLNGWGALYRTKTLNLIPLESVECPSCDMTRGFWLTARGHKNYLNPFDFSAKLCPPNAEGVKNQLLKWTGGDVFSMRTKLSVSDFPDSRIKIFVWVTSCMNVIILPISFLIGLISNIFFITLNFFYINFTAVIIMLIMAVVWILALIIALLVTKTPLKHFFLWLIFYGLMGGCVLYKKIFMTIKDGITKKWSSGSVTVKGSKRTTPKQKLRMCLFDGCIILIALTVCLILNFTIPATHLNRFVIWFNIFIFITWPSIIYIIWVWIGEIKVKWGWDEQTQEFKFWEKDMRYDFVSNTEIWKKQHSQQIN